jgi:hypothetical protein
MENMQEMDMAADEAKQDLEKMLRDNPELRKNLEPLKAWWKKWFMKAGHKRLGRIVAGM